MGFLGFGGYGGGASSLAVAGAAGDEEWGSDDDGRSIRFEPDDTAYLNRTFSGGNRRKWTFSTWLKRSELGANQAIFTGKKSGTNSRDSIRFDADNSLLFDINDLADATIRTTNKFVDTAAWGHLVVAVDTEQNTASNRVKIYWNGSQITDFSTANYPAEDYNCNFNSDEAHGIGVHIASPQQYFGGYLSEMHFIDDAQLAASSFGSADSDGIWNPTADLSGLDYGETGFYLKFDDASAIGDDRCGKNNDWTVNNLTGTDGSNPHNIDFVFDHPISDGTDNRAGGEIRGNYCTLNPLDAQSGVVLKQGNLRMDSTGDASCRGTIPNVNQKWYFEATVTGGPGASQVGVHNANLPVASFTSDHMDYRIDNGEIYGGSGSHPGTTFGVGDTIGVAVNKADATGTISFYKNGSLIQTRNLSAATNDNPVVPNTRTPSSGVIDFNFGQRAFRNAAPAGYKCWAAPNLAAPAITKPIEHFDVALYTGTGSGLSVSSLEFQPDFTWIKSRTDSNHNHLLYDDIRGSTKYLSTNGTGHGDTASLAWSPSANGFTISTNSNYNTNGHNYVSWNWKAATSQGNSNGENITVASGKQQVNTTAGFSITEFTGDGSGSADSDSGDSVGHGLSKAPEWLMLKRFDTAQNNWICWHKDFGNAKMIHANTTGARSGTNYCIPTAPTSTKVDLGNNPEANASGHKYMLYCWHGVEGYCKIGTYEGGTVGTFVHTGFAPMLIWVKNSDMGPSDWTMLDRRRESINPNNNWLPCNHGGPELQQQTMNFLSNGFTLQSTSEGSNHPSGTYIYMAWAQHPFKTTRAY